jgi:hypothetical protein
LLATPLESQPSKMGGKNDKNLILKIKNAIETLVTLRNLNQTLKPKPLNNYHQSIASIGLVYIPNQH